MLWSSGSFVRYVTVQHGNPNIYVASVTEPSLILSAFLLIKKVSNFTSVNINNLCNESFTFYWTGSSRV